MRTVSSYGVEIRKQNIPARQTMEIYRQAVGYLTEIYAQVWEELRKIPETKKRFNTAEHMVHMTKKNTARFDFDLRFPKMPSYLRRSAIQHALGSVSSYETRLGQWKETGVLSGRPKLTCRNHAMPVFYRDVMYREGAEGTDEAYLKLYDGHDWKWFRVYLKRTDMEYLRRNWKGKKEIMKNNTFNLLNREFGINEKVLNLPFIEGLRKCEADNAIDLYISDEYEDLLKDGVWQRYFTSCPEPFTADEKKAWHEKMTDVALGSDAFFPFEDNIERAVRSGVKYIAQPGGSVRDGAVIECCDNFGIAMAMTGIRLFHH